ncbi:MAG TPA: hypothetical protein VHM91_09740 [Verrucomicrobiales bacterium]|nr:hypothetical protein [Verrucomicrobiales bacterium]
MNLRTITSLLLTGTVLLGAAETSRAVIVSIGTQHFGNGQTNIGSGTYNTAVAAQPSPFNGFLGGDVAGPDFDATWIFTYSSVPTVSGASLTIGLYDGDFATTGTQLSLLSIDGNNITGLASLIFEAGPGATNQYGVYEIALPASVYASLQDGSATIHMTLATGGGILGPTSNNGAGIDFAILSVQVPEAGPGMLVCLGGAALAARRRRCAKS